MSVAVLTIGVFCLWPLLVGLAGFVIGRNRVRLRNPIVMGTKDIGTFK